MFKNNDFLKTYKRNKTTIRDTTNVHAKASYMFLKNEELKNESAGWESSSHINCGHRAALYGLYNMMKKALKETLDIEYEYFDPGFVLTKHSS